MNLFVYGTLRPGGRFWDRLAPWVREVRPTGVVGEHSLFAGPTYPLAAPAPDGWGPPTGVVGEPVVVDDTNAAEALAVLDVIEGVPDLFRRVEVGDLWFYVATPDTLLDAAARPLPTGDWFDVEPAAREAWEVALATPYTGPTCRYGPA